MLLKRHKRDYRNNFTIISNSCVRNAELSLKAKGVLLTIMALPDDWDFSLNGLIAIVKEGETAIRQAIAELIKAGYCQREAIRDKGKFVQWQYTFDDEPFVEKPFVENPKVVNPQMEKPQVENQGQLRKKEIKNLVNQELNKTNSLSKLSVGEFLAKEEECQAKENTFLANQIEFSPAIDIYQEFYPTHFLNDKQLSFLTNELTDIDESLWRKVLQGWQVNGYKSSNLSGLVDRYKNEQKKGVNQNGKSNNSKKGNADILEEYAEYFASETFQTLGSN